MEENSYVSKQMLLYVEHNNDVNGTLNRIFKTSSYVVFASSMVGVFCVIGLILIIIGSNHEYKEIFNMLGFFVIGVSVFIFLVIILGILVNNGKVKKYIKSNISSFMSELSGNYYSINDFDTYFTKNHIICHCFNKIYAVSYSDIAEVYTEPVASTTMKSFNNYGIFHAMKFQEYNCTNNIIIKTKDNKKYVIPSPNIDDEICKIIYSRNNNIKLDVNIDNALQSDYFNLRGGVSNHQFGENNSKYIVDDKIARNIKTMAISSVLCGIVSIFVLWWLAELGMFLGIFSLSEMKKKKTSGKAIAICGIVICITSMLLYIFYTYID